MERFSPTSHAGIVKIAKNGNSSVLHVPRPIMHALNLKIGSFLRMRIVDGALVFRSLDQILEEGERAVKTLDEKAADLVQR